MIIINLLGGLGNQMFQYAAARAISLEKKQKLRLNANLFHSYTIQSYGLNHFNIPQNFYKKPNKFFQKIQGLFYKKMYYKETEFQFNSDLLKLQGNPIFLDGYFQSEKYFSKYRDQLLLDFQISSPIKKISTEHAIQMQKEQSVSIHFRRGDYLQHEVHNTDKTQYYLDAVSLIQKKVNMPIFYLFSDDMEWVKQNFKLSGIVNYIDFNDEATNYEDMFLMSKCKNNIIANSSFSWWSAWLNTNEDKIVIAPKKWFNGADRNYSDVIPSNWIKI